MPAVPRSNVIPMKPQAPLADPPSPVDFAMAAATMHEMGRLIDPYPDMTDEEWESSFTDTYSKKTVDKDHIYEPKDAEGIYKHVEDIDEGFFRQDQEGMEQFLKEHGSEYDIKRTPQEGNGKRGYYIRKRMMM